MASCRAVGCLLVMLLSAIPGARGQQPSATGTQVAAALETALVRAIARCEKSVVAIARVRGPDDAAAVVDVRGDPDRRQREFLQRLEPTHPDFIPQQYGTGVVIDRRGLILTQYHLLDERDTHWVTTADRRVLPATIKAADPRSGLAILAVDADDLEPISLGDAAGLRKGQLLIALGNPYAIARDGQASASWGIVANLARKAGPTAWQDGLSETGTLHQFGTLIQTDAKLNLGTSGGALINLRGEMVGLTTTIAALAGYEQAAGYAVPMDAAFRRVIEVLKDGREVEYGLLGVRPENLPAKARRQGKHGIVVGEVVAGTPAARTGLEPLDVITHINDRPIHDADQLVLEVNQLLAGTPVQLAVERGSRKVRFAVSLAKYPVRGEKIVTKPRPFWRGIRPDYATAVNYHEQLRLGRLDVDGCVLIAAVEQPSPAWREGLRAGMYVSHVEGRRVRTPQEFRQAVTGRNGPVRLKLTLPADREPVRTIPPEM